jgi:hypothetical protein
MNKKSIVFLFLLFICICGVTYASDFEASCAGGKIHLDINKVEKWVHSKSNNTVWIKGNSYEFGHWKEDFINYVCVDISGPELSGNYVRYSASFKIWGAGASHDCEIGFHFYIDNSAPKPEISSSSGAKYLNGKYYARNGVVMNVFVPKDPGGEAGVGLSSVSYFLDGDVSKTHELSPGADGSCSFQCDIPNVEGKHTLEVTATDKLGNTNTSSSIIFIDYTEPRILYIIPPIQTEWSNKNASLIAVATDGVSGIDDTSWCCSLDGGATWSEKSSSAWLVALTESGAYKVAFKVSDKAGNTLDSSLNKETVRTVNIDKTPPTINKIEDDPGGKWVKSATISTSASDLHSGVNASSWQYSTDDGKTWSAASKDYYKVTLETSGTYTVRFRVSDNVGNESISDAHTVLIDAESPVLSVKNTASAGWNASAVLTATASDGNSGIDTSSWRYSTDGGKTWKAASDDVRGMTWKAASDDGYTMTLTLSNNNAEYKPYKVLFKVSDNTGNETVSPVQTVNIDTSVPHITLSGVPAEGTWSSGAVTVTASISPIGGSGINAGTWEYSLDGGVSYKTSTSTPKNAYTFGSSLSGTYTIQFRVFSNAGVTGVSPAASLMLDNQKPVVTITSDPDSRKPVKSCTLSASASDKLSGINTSSWKYTVDGGSAISGSSVELNTDGTHTVVFTVKDAAGNMGTAQRSVTIDCTGPAIEVSKSVSAEWARENTVSAKTSDTDANKDTWRYTVKAGSEQTTGNGFSVTLNSHGKYTVVFYADDKLGNTGVSKPVSVSIDRYAPEFADDCKKDGNKITASAKDTDSGIDLSSYKYRREGESAYTAGNTAELPEGKDRNVWFIVSDAAGNVSSEKRYTVTVDTTPPVVSFACADSVKGGELTLSSFSAADKVSGLSKLFYSIDYVSGSVWTAFEQTKSSYSGDTLTLSAENWGDGRHTLSIKAVDAYGNSYVSSPCTFINDKTAPQITTVRARYNGSPIDSGAFVGEYVNDSEETNELTILPDASDTAYAAGGKTVSGTVESWAVGISDKEGTLPSKWYTFSASEDIVVNNDAVPLFSGLNYVYVQASDEAGNKSAYAVFEVLKDIGIPTAPVVTSSSHRRALKPEDAELCSDAVFTVKPRSTGESGISGYKWKLEKCRIVNGAAAAFSDYDTADYTIVHQKGTLSLEFDALPDNEPDDYYCLAVLCIGGTGEDGRESVYPFRIDTNPPEGISLHISPETDADSYYNAAVTVFTWNKPADKTGISEYVLTVTDTASGSSRTYTADSGTTELQAGLPDLLADGKLTGEFEASVEAVDYAGNSEKTTRSFKIDTESPVFASGAAVEKQEDTYTISWGALTDACAGIENISLNITGLLASDTSSRSILLDGTDTSYTISTLKNNAAYVVSVKGYDKAGNFSVVQANFTTGTAALPVEIRTAYAETIDGYVIKGTAVENTSDGTGKVLLEGGVLELPASVTVSKTTKENGKTVEKVLKELPLQDDTVINGSRSISSALSETGAYTVLLNGFVLQGKGFSFAGTQGLSLLESAYSFAVYNKKHEKITASVKPGTINLGAGENPLVHSALVSLSPAVKAATDGFTLEQVKGLTLSGSKTVFSGTTGQPVTFTPEHIAVSCADGSKAIPLNDVNVGAENSVPRAAVKSDSIKLVLNDTVLTVKKSGINGSLYEVYEAVLELPDTYEIDGDRDNHSLVLRNFTINDTDGTVTQCADFACSKITNISGTAHTVTMSGITIDSAGRIYASGEISAGVYGSSFDAQNILLTNNGADMETGGHITGFETTVYGFKLKSDDAFITDSGVYIRNGLLTVYGGDRHIAGLGLRTDAKDSVYHTGTSGDVFTVDTQYTKEVTVKGLSVTGSGVSADEMDVPLPGTQDSVWKYEQVSLSSNNTCSGTSTAAQTLVIGGYTVSNEKSTFSGERVVIEKGYVTVPGTFSTGKLEMEHIAFNGTGLLSGGTVAAGKENTYTYSFSGWNYIYSALQLASDGLHGSGYVHSMNEESGEGWDVYFPDFAVAADGSVTPGKSEMKADVYQWCHNGYYLSLPDAYMKQDSDGVFLMYCDEPAAAFDYCDDTVALGKIAFNAAGKVLISEKSTKESDFVSYNNYSVQALNARFVSDAVCLEGKIKPETWTSYVQTGSTCINLHDDGTVTFLDSSAEITYDYEGWNIKGTGVKFDDDSASVTGNTVVYNGSTLNLGTLYFTSDGVHLGEDCQYQSVNVPIVTGKSEIRETIVDDDGIRAVVNVVLPDMFNNDNVLYRDVRLHQDGTYFINQAIENYTVDLGAVKFEFNHMLLTEKGLEIANSVITLTALDNTQIKLRGLNIGNDGNVSLKGAATSPFTLWNMTYCISNLAVENNEISIAGYLTLPEAMPGALSGRTLGIRKFRIGLDGTVKELDARMEGSFVVPFLENWALSLKGVGVGYKDGAPYVALDEAGLIFPSDFFVDAVKIDNVMYDPVHCQFDFDKITADTSIAMECSGIQFNLTQLTIDKEMTVGFSGSAAFTGESLPGFIKGKSAVIKKFEIKKDGTIGSISITLDGLDGEIAPNLKALRLEDGSVSVEKEDGADLYLNVTGALSFTENAPECLQSLGNGVALRVDTFTIDASKPEITALSARLSRKMPDGSWSRDPAAINFDPVLYGSQLNDVYVSFDWDGARNDGTIALAGGLVLPETLPEGIAGTEVRLDSFEIGIDGSIKSFGASYALDKTSISAIDLSGVKLAAAYKDGTVEYAVAATMTLSKASFPEGIGGLTTQADFVFTAEQIKSAYAACSVPDQLLMNSLKMQGVRLQLEKENDIGLVFSFGGSLLLPDSFPNGLSGVKVAIRNFTIAATGEIIDVNIGVENMSAKLFNALALENGAVNFAKGNDNDFDINVTGQLAFTNDSMPDGLKNTTFEIDELRFSTRTGLKKFTAGMHSSMKFTMLGGLDFTVTQLAFSETGFTVGADVRVNFNSVNFGDTTFSLQRFEMGWDGSIKALEGGIKQTKVSIAGFTGSISGLYVLNSSSGYMVALKECRITMPDNFGSLGGKDVALKNATFNPSTGDFDGDIEAPQLECAIVGFTLVLDKPTINFKKCAINFSTVSLKMPEFMGNGLVSLSGVEVSASNGFKVGGGGFTLPDFKVGEAGFFNVGAEFAFDSDGNYFIAGHGGAMIPGAGIIEVAMSFTNVSATYPIGLKYAYFSYEAYVGGIPLGSTGLYLCGIRGGLAFGFPDEIPARYRSIFGDGGTRIQLGLTVNDQSGGKMAHITADAWVDITKVAWVFEGNATILKGTLNINARAAAIIKNDAFATGLQVRILFIKGSIELYLFGKDGQLKFSGKGAVSFGMPKAYLHDGSILKIPSSDIWFGEIGTMFGDFTNGKRGFLGYIDINICGFELGRVGAFVGDGGLDVDVSSYQILKPDGIDLSKNIARVRTVDMNRLRNGLNGNGSGSNGNVYYVTIPSRRVSHAADGTPVLQNTMSVRAQTLQGQAGSDSSADASYTESGPGKAVFAIGYKEGSPDFTVVSPGGKTYKAGDEGVETSYIENGMIISVEAPETGKWSITVSNLDEGSYEIAVLGVNSAPDVTVTEPGAGVQSASGTLAVAGTVTTAGTKVHVFACENDTDPDMELGTLTADSSGRYEGTVSSSSVADGEYRIAVRAETDDGFYSPAAYSAGKYRIDRSGLVLNAPENVRAAETAAGTVQLSWKNTNGARNAGYYLITKNVTTGTEMKSNIGNITSVTIENYADKIDMQYAVSAYDGSGAESAESAPVSVLIGSEKDTYNSPSAAERTIEVSVDRGDSVQVSIPVTVGNFYISGTSSDYLMLRRKYVKHEEHEPEDDIQMLSVKDVQVTGKTASLSAYISMNDKCPAGTYTIPCEIVNEGNYELTADVIVKVTVTYPQPTVARVVPSTINGKEENEVTVFGSGFISGTRYYFEGEEIAAADSENNGMGCMTLKVPVCTHRGSRPLVITGPDGKTVTEELNVVVPDWSAVVYTSEASVHPGETAEYPVKLERLDGYTGTPSFTVTTEAGLQVSAGNLALDETGTVLITVPSGCPAGTYKTVLDGGDDKIITLTTIVTTEHIQPVISSASPGTGYAGTVVTVFGYGFGTGGTLSWNGETVKTDTWNGQAVTFTVTSEMKTGKGRLRIATDSGTSNEIPFSVRQRGFVMHLQDTVLDVPAGKSVQTNLAVNGYAERVAFTVNVPPESPFKVQLSSDSCVPNGVVSVNVLPDDNAPNGTWKFTITGTCEDCASSVTVEVQIGDAFEITTKKLPAGTVGVPYHIVLASANDGGSTVKWKLSSGFLPQGVSLSSDGTIEGTPQNAGDKSVGVTAYTKSGKEASAEFMLQVQDDIWGQKDKNGGGIRSTAAEAPSTDRLGWKAGAGTGITQLYVNFQSTVAVRKNGVTVLSAGGALLWKDKNVYAHSLLTGTEFIGLRNDGMLVSESLVSGLTVWSRAHVDCISSDGSVLLAVENGTCSVLDASSGTLLGTCGNGFTAKDTIIWNNGCAWKVTPHGITAVYGTDSLWTTEKDVFTAVCDPQGVAVAVQDGIILLDSSLKELRRVDCSCNKDTQLAMDKDSIAVKGSAAVAVYNRKTGSYSWSVPSDTQFALASEKLITAGDNGITVYNRYTGKSIWHTDGTYTAAALYGQNLYAATDSSVMMYNGEANATAPVTKILYTIAAPDGTNGWYRTLPGMYITSEDAETYVADIQFRRDNGAWQPYTEPVQIQEGWTSTQAYGTDSKGYRGVQAESSVKADITKPVSSCTLSGTLSATGWYSSDVTAAITAEDNLSGVASIQTQDGRYASPVTYTAEGIHTLLWHAEDNAGNEEEPQSVVIKIDKSAPYAHAAVRSGSGIAEVTITGNDNGSGLDYIEYRINDGDTQKYDAPIVLLKQGRYRIEYRATDKSGWSCSWKQVYAYVSRNIGFTRLIALADVNGDARTVRAPLYEGMMLYERQYSWQYGYNRRRMHDPFVHQLTHYARGGDYIEWNAEDDGSTKQTARFYVKQDAVLYLFADKTMPVPEGWAYVEEGIDVNSSRYNGTCSVYMKRVKAGVQTVITTDGEALPLIAAQSVDELHSAVTISERNPFSFTLPGMYDLWHWPRPDTYRSGTVLNLEAVVWPEYSAEKLPLTDRWYYSVAGGAKTPLEGDGYEVPSVTEDTEITLYAELATPDGYIVTTAARSITAEPKPAEQPYDGWWFFTPQSGTGNSGGRW